MTKLVIIILSAQIFRDTRQKTQCRSWIQDIPEDVPYYFIEGGHEPPVRLEGNALQLSCKDDYESLSFKTYQALSYIDQHVDFDYVFKCDDDTYVDIKRLKKMVERCNHDYVGSLFQGFHPRKTNYRIASGGGYLLSRHAVKCILKKPLSSCAQQGYEDVMVYDYLKECNIHLRHDNRLNPEAYPDPYEHLRVVSCHHVDPTLMEKIWMKKTARKNLRLFFKYFSNMIRYDLKFFILRKLQFLGWYY